MTNRLCLFLGIWVGILLGAWVAIIGNNERWKMAAWEHHAAVWHGSAFDDRLEWQWQDEYLQPSAQPTVKPYKMKVIINGRDADE